VPLTHDCPWHCTYCGYRSDHDGLITEAELTRLLDLAVRQGATEVLFLSGEIPDTLPHLRRELAARGFLDFIEFTRAACLRALDLGLLPHTNLGALSKAQLARLADVNASMGVMLENHDDAFNRTVAPEKSVAGRLRTLHAAGELRIPYTSGILIGLGESQLSRLRSLDVLAEVHARHGHLQEIILQNYLPNAGSRLQPTPPAPALEEYRELMAHWRRVAPDVAIQLPPNLNPHWQELLPFIDDLGGISAEGDLVNPENPWEPPAVYAAAAARHGRELQHRWAVHDRFIRPDWVHPPVLEVLHRRSPSRVNRRSDVPSDAQLLDRATQGDGLPEEAAVRWAERDGAAAEELAAAADELTRRLHGDVVTYVVNRNANFTNVCTTHCSFCGFYRPAGHPEAYTRSIQSVVERVGQTPWVTEICLQGGIHPDLTFDYYEDLLRALKAAFPHAHLHAYSPMEIHSLRRKTGWELSRIFGRLIDAGLGSTPGTAAEVLDDRLRQELSPDRLSTHEWEEIVEAAHRSGLRSTATIMFGHREDWGQVFRHLGRLQALHRRTGGFTEFIPLAFMPHRNRLGTELSRDTGLTSAGLAERGADRIRSLYPLARLFFGRELPNLQTSWVKLGPQVAADLLRCGCNDFGGTLYEESITRESGGPYGESLSPAAIQAAIRSVGRVPRQRTTLYGQVAQTVLN
jgi:FO synthase